MKRTHEFLPESVLALMLLLIAVLAPVPASADGNSSASSSFNCYLIVNQAASIPDKTFTYTITPGSSDTIGGHSVVAGITNNGKPSIGSAVFTSSDTSGALSTVSTADAGSITLDANEKYVKKTVSIDFSGVTFTQPGIYRYVVTQADNDEKFSHDMQVGTGGTAGTRYLDVYVANSGSGLAVSAYLLHKTNAVTETGTASDKSTGFVNLSAIKHSLSFGKAVKGNMGSKDKYFKFTLSLGRLHKNATYQVDLTKAEASPANNIATVYTGMTNPASITTSGDGAATYTCYLKHGQVITLQGLPAGYTYELSEANEDYTSAQGIASSDWTVGEPYQNSVSNATGAASDVKTGFTNTFNTQGPPTGVLLTIAPFAVGLFLFGAAFFFMLTKNRRMN